MITVFTSCHNQGKYLAEAIRSVLDQTYSDFEYLIYDDGSTDNTWDIIQSFAQKDKRIRPFKISKSANVGVVINKSIKQARGDVWTWCPSDDIWLPNLLAIKSEEAKKYPSAVLYSDWIIIDQHGQEIGQVHPERRSPEEFKEVVWRDSPIGFTGIWIPMEVFSIAGRFPEHLDYSEDFYWMIKATIHGVHFRSVPQILHKKRTHNNTTTEKNRKKILEDVPKIREELRRYKTTLNQIPKKMHFFWANESMSWLRYMTLYSFRKLNPDWEIELYLSKRNEIRHKPWMCEPVQDFFNFSGNDYLKQAEQLDITIKEWDIGEKDGQDWQRILCPSHKSNFFKWEKLSTDGGFYSDLDILYLRPMSQYYENVKNYNLVICYQNRYFSIGFLGSSANNKFYRDVFLNAFNNFNVNRYQTVGVENIYAYLRKISNTPNDVTVPQIDFWRIIEKHYPDIKAYNNKMELVYPWPYDRMEDVFNVKHTHIPEGCIGIHWYAGDPISQKYNNLLTQDNYEDFDNTYCYFAGKILNGQAVPSVAIGKDNKDSERVPTPKEFILRESRFKAKRANLSYARLLTANMETDGLCQLHFVFNNKGKEWENTKFFPYADAFREFLVVDPETKEDLLVTAKDIYHGLRQGYDFLAAKSAYRRNRLGKNARPSIAFTVKHSSTIGGGTANIFEYANWLSDLGVDVAVYSDDEPPDWTDVKGRFYYIEDIQERYAAITEPVIVVYSILELQDLLYCCDTKNKVIYHLCQGIEEYHYCVSTYSSLIAPKTMFEFLFSLPVGRIVVSPHLRDYFKKNYYQKTFNIFNSVDRDFFKFKPKDQISPDINILSSGNPQHKLKGKTDIKEALDRVAKAYPDLNFCLTVTSGQRNIGKDLFGHHGRDFTSEINFDTGQSSYVCKVRYGLSQGQMRQAYYDSDIYINSSWYEGFGLPTLEAMACGLPVIQADNQGLDGTVVDGKNCLLIPPNNPQKMAEAIETLIKDDALRNNLIKNGIKTVEQFIKNQQRAMFISEFEKILQCNFDEVFTDERNGEHYNKNVEIKSGETARPLFTVLVPTYNQAKFLPEALDSLMHQTWGDWEAVVVNDGSTDRTAEVMKHYAEKDSRIRIFHKDNGGVGSALNEGLRNARGQWICWLSSDDLFELDKLKTHLQAIKEHPDIRFFHTNYFILDDEAGCRRPAKSDLDLFIPPVEQQVLKFFEINYFNGISIAVHRDVFEEVGYFNERYKNGQDFDMWLRISAFYRSFFINRRTCTTRIHPAQGTDISVGTVLYDSFGIFDSAVACLEFLNNHDFPALFPSLNLSIPEEALFAIKSTLKIVVNPLSFINRCGFAPALVDRLHEWLLSVDSMKLRSMVKPQLVQIINNLMRADLQEETRTSLKSMCESLQAPLPNERKKAFYYNVYDPLNEMAIHADRLEKTGESKRASLLKDYLAKASKEKHHSVSVNGRPLFSIIVPTYNQAMYLPQSLDSILGQTYDNWEAIVVNDGSTDQTSEVLRQYTEKDSRIRVIDKKNGGVSSALNEGIKSSKGEWICWLSSDDVFEPDKLQIHVQAIEENPDIRFFHTNYLIFDERKNCKCALLTDPAELVSPEELQILKFFERNCANGISVAIHRQVFDNVGYFNEQYRYGQDFDMWLRINAHYRAHFIDQKTCVTRWHSQRGTSGFPEGGFYDSSRSCIEFLNSHPFSEYFPLIDLTTSSGVTKAVKETLAVVFNPNAMMYKCYFNTVLLERLCEWLSQHCPAGLKQALVTHLQRAIGKLMSSQLPEEMKAGLSEFSENVVKDFHFSPHDFLKEADEYAKTLYASGNSMKAESIKRYLSLVQGGGNTISPFHERSELVSVIMPAYNAGRYITKSIESVLAQDYGNFELIVVDDGSTDSTRDIVEGFKDDRIRYFRRENTKGAASARNLAIRKSKGAFSVNLDTDDMIVFDFINRHLREFENHPDADLIYCDDLLIDEEDKPIRVIKRPEYTNRKLLIRELFRCGFPIVPFRTCIRKSVFDKIGLFDEDLPVAEDYDMMRKLVKKDLKMYHFNGALYLRRITENSLSRTFTAEKAKAHFAVIKRYADTFDYEELFPDVDWEKIEPEKRGLHAKYLVAETISALGQSYSSNAPVYTQVASELALSILDDCLKAGPENILFRNLMEKSRLVRRNRNRALLNTLPARG